MDEAVTVEETAPKLPPARERVHPINERIAKLYTEFEGLNYEGRLQLLVAVILSAQCTDARVNKITPGLFARFKTVADFATCDIKELQRLVKPSGFYKNKAKNIRACCVELVNRFGGEVPSTLEELVTLPGVGRKTANVILGHGFGKPGVTVDTHVGRLSRRLGLTRHRDPKKVELALAEIVPQSEWLHFSGRLIMHGRKVCLSRKPRCEICPIADLCPKIGVKGLAAKRKRKAFHHKEGPRPAGGKVTQRDTKKTTDQRSEDRGQKAEEDGHKKLYFPRSYRRYAAKASKRSARL